MRQYLKNYLQKTLAKVNVFPTRLTEHREIRSLLKKLYPIISEKELIRFGPDGDGGYLLPNDLIGIEACFSPGVRDESGFEKNCAESGMKVFLADKTVEKPAFENESFSFIKKFIGATTNDDFMTLDEWVHLSLPKTESELLLQMDIEGYEYEVFLSASNDLMRRSRIIIAEFHLLDHLWSKPFFRLAKQTFEKILQTHSCIHIHPNNWCGSFQKGGISIPRAMEFTFLRNDRFVSFEYQKKFPNPLDYDNTAKPTLILPKCWYGN